MDRIVYDSDMPLRAAADEEVGRLEVRILLVRYIRSLRWNYRRLSAPYWRLYWNATPGGRVRSSGHITDLEPETVYLIPPDTQYDAIAKRPVDHFFAHFSLGDTITSARPGVYALSGTADLSETARSVAFAAYHDEGGHSTRLAAAGLCLSAVARLPDCVQAPLYTDPVVRRVVDFVDKQMSDRLTAQQLARVAACHPRTLRRRFRRQFGMSPSEYLIRRRINESCMLLHYTGLSIDEIAEKTGFCDRYHFSRAFARIRRMGPAGFRRTLPWP